MTETLQLLLLALVLIVLVLLAALMLRRRTVQARESEAAADKILAEARQLRSETEAARAELACDREAARVQLDTEREKARTRLEQDRATARTELDAERDKAFATLAADREKSHRALDAERQQLLSEISERREAVLADLAARGERAEAERRERSTAVEAELAARASALAEDERRHTAELERIAGLTSEEAARQVTERVSEQARRRALGTVRQIEQDARERGEARARQLITGAIQRLAAEQTSETVVAMIALPSEDLKGRIIGREGRNIRAFEQITGANVMIDDTPGTVLVSCFDPVRREVARHTMIDLVADGRINPARIEEVHARSVTRIEQKCAEAAEAALDQVGITDLDPALQTLLGALNYRTSYGQNVLKHLIECAHLAGLLAGELGLDVATCKRAAFLHDIGKALTHEMEGTHALVGAEMARKHGEHPDIVHAIEAHHNEVEPRTVEAVLTQAVDAISGGRPGARRESLEAYVQRLERLEQIAAAHDGVDKVFAMQAGREVRVMVAPAEVDDTGAQVLARDIAAEIEAELTYPGQINVTVVRESRATGLAH